MIIHSLDQLLELPRNGSVNGLNSRSRVRVLVKDLPAPERLRAERALNRLQSRCGCVAAGLAMLAVTTLGIARWYPAHGMLSGEGARLLGKVFILGIGAGMIAKLATLLVTRVQFDRECRIQHDALSRIIPR